MAEKTEQPTPKRLRDAARRGHVAFSVELPGVATLMAGVVGLSGVGRVVEHAFHRLYATVIQTFPHGSHEETLQTPLQASWQVGWTLLAPILFAIVGTGVLMAVVQVGVHIRPALVRPSMQRLHPGERLRRWFSSEGGIALIKITVKLGIIGTLGWSTLRGWDGLGRLFWADARGFLVLSGQRLQSLAWTVGLVWWVIAALDYGLQRRRWRWRLRMSREEVREEIRETEGDPLVRAHRKEIHRALLMEAGVHEITRADVVVTNPLHLAVALRYEPMTMKAPAVVARGQGWLAHVIVRTASRHQIPVVSHPPLAQALFRIHVGQPIPRELYEVVAEVLRWAWRWQSMDGKETT